MTTMKSPFYVRFGLWVFLIYDHLGLKTGLVILRSSFAVPSLFVRSSFEAEIGPSDYFS